ncbi:MAG: PfkB family carbohydrate kinase [Pseudomonadota bacterium]
MISSQVLVGQVGTSIIAPAFSRLGLEGIFVPTVLLSSRPGLGRPVRHAIDFPDLKALLDTLDRDGLLDSLGAVLTGYFADAEQVSAVADFVHRLKADRPDLPVIVDPVIGDIAQGLFVDASVARAIRTDMIPCATVATPNRFELGWLTNTQPKNEKAIDAAARALGPEAVVVTSSADTEDAIETRYVDRNTATAHVRRRFDAVPNGTGDLFASLLAGLISEGLDVSAALASACDLLEGVAETSQGRAWLDVSTLTPKARRPDWIAGVDGCRGGWAAVFVDRTGGQAPRFRVLDTFQAILDSQENPRIVAVDMPIGLPDQVGAGGRGPEAAVRSHLGARQSSVFSIPARAAVYAPDYRTACTVALATSTPPRKVSKQGFMLFEKIREIDQLMTPRLADRVFEVHPELAFWRLNGERAMSLPKKIKGRPNPEGLAERRGVLMEAGLPPDFLDRKLPRGVAADDFIDACACVLIADRLADGDAAPFPERPARDGKGLTVAIWA